MARPADPGAQPALLDLGKKARGPLRVIVKRAFVERWTCAHKLECGHEYTVRGDSQPKDRMRHKQEAGNGAAAQAGGWQWRGMTV